MKLGRNRKTPRIEELGVVGTRSWEMFLVRIIRGN